MAMVQPEASALLEQLAHINGQLLSLNACDLSGVGEALEHRGQLISRLGHLLRCESAPKVARSLRDSLDQALEAGDVAIRRLLALRQTIRLSELHLCLADGAADGSPDLQRIETTSSICCEM